MDALKFLGTSGRTRRSWKQFFEIAQDFEIGQNNIQYKDGFKKKKKFSKRMNLSNHFKVVDFILCTEFHNEC